jgi:hypothetical protein
MISIRKFGASLFLFLLLMENISIYGADRASQADFSSLIAGVSSVCAVGVPGPLWTLSENVIPIVSGDEDTTPVPSVVTVATVFGNGRVVALGHEGFLTNEAIGLFDNKKFGDNIVDWLDKSGTKKILVTTGHREWYGGANFDSFKQELENRGYMVTRFSGQVSASSLSGVSVVLIGNAGGDFSQQEVDELKSFVSNGGGLLLMGLGWSWEPYNPGKTLDDYPMNKIGEVFGIRWIDGYISDPTNNYNGQPIFHTFYPNIELQTIYQAFSYINTTTKAHQTDLPSLLQNDVVLRRSYVNAHLLIATASRALSASSTQRQEIYNFYKNLINSNPQYFKKNIVYDRSSQSVMAWLRERVYRSLIDTLPLTEDVKSEIALTLGLTGRYLDIWSEFSVLLLDNNGLDPRQRDFIYTYLSMTPKDLHNLHTISVVDFLGVLPPSTPEIYLWGKEGSVNIFGFKIGEYTGNEFPDDVLPKYSDSFCIVIAHEVNHIVDAYYVSRNQALRERRDELISRAGNYHMNYLRSMLPDGFFVSAPQEFFASIANQWFSDSALTLRLALVRFDKGYKEPLNQFLFFSEVYSRKGNSTLFYTIDAQGNIAKREVSVLRDKNGRINAIIDGTTMYNFTLDESGNVVSYSTVQAPSFYVVSFDIQPRVAGLVVDEAHYTMDQIPVSFRWIGGSVHSFEVPATIQTQQGVRYVFEEWSDGVSSAKRTLVVSSPTTFIARYRTEYLVSISSLYGTLSGGGWYEEGALATINVLSNIISGSTGERFVFSGWSGDISSTDTTVTFTVDRPKTIYANWKRQYYVTVYSDFSSFENGNDWCDEGSYVKLKLKETSLGFLVKKVFDHFEGLSSRDRVISNGEVEVFVDSPRTITAVWRTDYTQLLLFVFLAIIVGIMFIALAGRNKIVKAKKKE